MPNRVNLSADIPVYSAELIAQYNSCLQKSQYKSTCGSHLESLSRLRYINYKYSSHTTHTERKTYILHCIGPRALQH